MEQYDNLEPNIAECLLGGSYQTNLRGTFIGIKTRNPTIADEAPSRVPELFRQDPERSQHGAGSTWLNPDAVALAAIRERPSIALRRNVFHMRHKSTAAEPLARSRLSFGAEHRYCALQQKSGKRQHRPCAGRFRRHPRAGEQSPGDSSRIVGMGLGRCAASSATQCRLPEIEAVVLQPGSGPGR